MEENAKKILELFDEKYAKLNSSRLFLFINNPDWKSSFYYTPDNNDFNSAKPDEQDIDSYVLTLRFFIQDNEPISINNLSKLYTIYSSNKEIKEKFSELRNALNCELDKSCPILFNGQKLTLRKILNGFIYSELAHSNIEKHLIFQSLLKKPLGKNLALEYFLRCISLIHNTIRKINELNKVAFPDLKTE